MLLQEYFREHIMNEIAFFDNVKIAGSSKRGVPYVTDIDISSQGDKLDYDKIVNTITKKREIIFLYITMYHDPYVNIKINVTSKTDFSNINFDDIKNKLSQVFKNKLISEKKYNELIYYANNRTLKNVLKLEFEINTNKSKIKWRMEDIKKNKKIVDGYEYDFRDMVKHDPVIGNSACAIHWLWDIRQYPDGKFSNIPNNNTFILIDLGVVVKNIKIYRTQCMERCRYFYKDLFILYYEKDYFYLLSNLMHITKHNKLKNISKQIQYIIDIECGLYKQSINKLYEINKFYSDEYKNIVDIEIINKSFDVVKNNLSQLDYVYDEKITILENRQKLMDKLNVLVKPYYNTFRALVVKKDKRNNYKLPFVS